jgi:hypothetical protein
MLRKRLTRQIISTMEETSGRRMGSNIFGIQYDFVKMSITV